MDSTGNPGITTITTRVLLVVNVCWIVFVGCVFPSIKSLVVRATVIDVAETDK